MYTYFITVYYICNIYKEQEQIMWTPRRSLPCQWWTMLIILPARSWWSASGGHFNFYLGAFWLFFFSGRRGQCEYCSSTSSLETDELSFSYSCYLGLQTNTVGNIFKLYRNETLQDIQVIFFVGFLSSKGSTSPSIFIPFCQKKLKQQAFWCFSIIA